MRVPLRAAALLWAVVVPAGCCSTESATSPAPVWSVVYEADFTREAELEGYAFSDAERWRWHEGSLELLGQSDYAPPHRSPTSIALVPELELRDFDLEVELMQTGRAYGHRDLCLFFGFQDPAHYYYVHLATTPDANAHNVFRVDGAPRTNVAPVAAKGVDWGQEEWHRVRIERRVEAGTVRVFWDGGATPVLEATDATFGWGRIGFGSFDDSGRVGSVRIRAPESRTPAAAQPF